MRNFSTKCIFKLSTRNQYEPQNSITNINPKTSFTSFFFFFFETLIAYVNEANDDILHVQPLVNPYQILTPNRKKKQSQRKYWIVN